MGGSSETDDWLTGVEISGKFSDLFIRQLAETSADDHQIGGIQCLGAGDVFLEIWVDVAAVRIDGEEDDAVEAVFLAEDLGEHRAGLFAAIFFVARD